MTDTVTEKPVVTLGDVYPAAWDDFIGQDKAKRTLRTAVMSAKIRNAIPDHILLASGAHGVGKTSLALLVSEEIGGGFKAVSGSMDQRQAVVMFSDLDDGDVVFWDEFHLAVAGGKAKAEWLLNYLQDGVLLGPLGPEEVPRVTFICATTEPGKLPETITSRFMVKPTLVDYTTEEATRIALVMAPKIFVQPLPLPTHKAAELVAVAANNNPRDIRAILITMRNIALVEQLSNYNDTDKDYDLTSTLDEMEITPDGLSRPMQRYLVALVKRFAGGAGEKALMEALQEPGGLRHYERVLMNKGYIGLGPRGRYLLSPGAKRAKELIAEGVTV